MVEPGGELLAVVHELAEEVEQAAGAVGRVRLGRGEVGVEERGSADMNV